MSEHGFSKSKIKKILELKKREMLPREIISNLNICDEMYIEKLEFLTKIVRRPNIGYIIDKKLVNWCKEQGLKPELHCQDGTSWWTCSAR